jgi:hypothetical protein
MRRHAYSRTVTFVRTTSPANAKAKAYDNANANANANASDNVIDNSSAAPGGRGGMHLPCAASPSKPSGLRDESEPR